MREYFGEAVVLDRSENGDLDRRLFLFTRRFGKLSSRAKSARKITSKLSAHLEPGNLVDIRLVEKNGLQVADALKRGKLAAAPPDLHFLNRLLNDAEADPLLWQVLVSEKFEWRHVLKILGWDPGEAFCSVCGAADAGVFDVRSQEFFCGACASKLPRNDVIFIESKL